jgi:hypothetical protein
MNSRTSRSRLLILSVRLPPGITYKTSRNPEPGHSREAADTLRLIPTRKSRCDDSRRVRLRIPPKPHRQADPLRQNLPQRTKRQRWYAP